MRAWLLMMAVLGLAGCGGNETAHQADKLVEALWQARLDADPLYATAVGDPRGRDRLPDLSPAALARQDDLHASLLKRLDALDRTALDAGRRATVDIARLELRAARADYRFGGQRMVLSGGTGLVDGLAHFVDTLVLTDEAAAQAYVARLEAVPGYIDSHLAWLAEGLELGITQPAPAIAALPDNADRLLAVAVSASTWYKPLTSLPERIDIAAQAQLRLAGATAISQGIYPAIRRYRDFLVKEYLPRTRASLAISDVAGGGDYYRAQVAYYTTTDLTPEQIHALGEAEVARIDQEMAQLLEAAGIRQTPALYAAALRQDPQYVAASPQALLEKAAYHVKRAEAALPRLFHRDLLPRTPLAVAPVPAFLAPAYTTGRYAEAGSSTQPGTYLVNTYDLPARPLYELPALSLHEGTPGHHLQIAIADEQLGDLPLLRRHAYLSAFGEGWALYAERLGTEFDYYEDVASQFGRLSYEMWRACRLVVDTAIHHYGWDRQQAIDYLARHTALSRRNVETEVDRYIGWPGQALAYKVGELTLLRLRRQAQQELGERFDVRDFHAAVLGQGAVPLATVEEQVRDYIRQARATAE